MNTRQIMAIVIAAVTALCISFTSTLAYSDDNLIAHRLFEQGSYAEAAEIFTDPSWKGAAMYRSSQWWRAAEAFVRADDARSFYNLGNTYVQLGYYALALDAYKAALARQPDFDDASFNLELMRQLLAQDEQEDSENPGARRGEEIDKVESEGQEPGGSSGEDGEKSNEKNNNGEDREGQSENRGPDPDADAAADSESAGSDRTPEDAGDPEGGSVKGTEMEPTDEKTPSGGAEGKNANSDAQAAGLRAELAREQATEQWLNQIRHDAKKYLERRIELELARRKASGSSAPEGGSLW